MENGLPNYGLVFLPSVARERASACIEPILNTGEKYSWYVFEKYQQNTEGRYELAQDSQGETKVRIYRLSKEKKFVSHEAGEYVEILRPIIPTAKVSKEAGDKSGSTSFDWYPNSTRALKNFHFFLSGSFSFIFFQFFFRKSTKKLWLTP